MANAQKQQAIENGAAIMTSATILQRSREALEAAKADFNDAHREYLSSVESGKTALELLNELEAITPLNAAELQTFLRYHQAQWVDVVCAMAEKFGELRRAIEKIS
ncbi:MAG: hypothetical protein ACREQO_26430 [Candidatus Binatia bacterium]